MPAANGYERVDERVHNGGGRGPHLGGRRCNESEVRAKQDLDVLETKPKGRIQRGSSTREKAHADLLQTGKRRAFPFIPSQQMYAGASPLVIGGRASHARILCEEVDRPGGPVW